MRPERRLHHLRGRGDADARACASTRSASSPSAPARTATSASTVEIALVQPVAEGDVLLVHAGTAIAHADSEEAA